MDGHDLLRTAYDDLVAALAGIDDEQSWAPTGCLGWSVRDLTWHCAADARRALEGESAQKLNCVAKPQGTIRGPVDWSGRRSRNAVLG